MGRMYVDKNRKKEGHGQEKLRKTYEVKMNKFYMKDIYVQEA